MKISVITPSFNSVKTIERAIFSVMLQEYDDLEHIVIDGGSKDGTIDVLKKFPHIKWVSEPDNGQSDAMNKGFKQATGDIIVYLNSDDEFLGGIFNKINAIFEKSIDKSHLMVICDLKSIYEGGVEKITKPSSFFTDIINPVKLAFPYNPVSYFYSRNVQQKIGDFPSHFHYAMDYWFLIKAYQLSKVTYLPEIAGVFYNYDNKSSNRTESHIEILNILLVSLRESKKLFFLNKFWMQANLIKIKLIVNRKFATQ